MLVELSYGRVEVVSEEVRDEALLLLPSPFVFSLHYHRKQEASSSLTFSLSRLLVATDQHCLRVRALFFSDVQVLLARGAFAEAYRFAEEKELDRMFVLRRHAVFLLHAWVKEVKEKEEVKEEVKEEKEEKETETKNNSPLLTLLSSSPSSLIPFVLQQDSYPSFSAYSDVLLFCVKLLQDRHEESDQVRLLQLKWRLFSHLLAHDRIPSTVSWSVLLTNSAHRVARPTHVVGTTPDRTAVSRRLQVRAVPLAPDPHAARLAETV